MLKIEGKSSQVAHLRHDYDYEQSMKMDRADRDIKAELRKIYNLKSSPKKPNRRIIELPRIKWVFYFIGLCSFIVSTNRLAVTQSSMHELAAVVVSCKNNCMFSVTSTKHSYYLNLIWGNAVEAYTQALKRNTCTYLWNYAAGRIVAK